jgi:hypothetical protein
MRSKILVSFLCCLLVTLAACKKRAAAPLSQNSQANSPSSNPDSNAAKFDVCGLIKNEEIEAIQGSPIKETKSSGRSNAGIHTAQCFYTAAEFSRSVSLAVTMRDPDTSSDRSIKDFWHETFGRSEQAEKEREQAGDKEKKESLREQRREKGEEEGGSPPQKISGVGEDAYWSGNRVGGALYVLTKDAFVRISVGGADNAETKINKSKQLAEKAVSRLK